MLSLIILFNDAQALNDKLQELRVTTGVTVDLLYGSPNRPARMKRWVSRNGWERLTMERARKMTVDAEKLLIAKGAQVQVHSVIGDVWWEASARASSTGATLIDARATRYEMPSLQEAAEAAGNAVQATVQATQATAQWSHALVSPPDAATAPSAAPKVVYKSSLKRSYNV
jgi:hypothetical protein